MHTDPPSLPLTRAGFAAALRSGHGRAIQHVDQCGAQGLQDLIIEACTTCVSYDPQCEASRAPWLISIVERAVLSTQVMAAISSIHHDWPSSMNHRDSQLRCEVLQALAVAGKQEARSLLYEALDRSAKTADVYGVHEIIALDGADGLIHVARQLGRWLRIDPEFWVDDGAVRLFDAATQEDDGLALLVQAASGDPDVANYLAAISKAPQAVDSAPTHSAVMAYSGDEVVAYVINNPKDPCHWLRRWGIQAADNQRERVFTALLASQEVEQVKRLLRCFASNGVPRFERRLLVWLNHADTRIRWAVATALAPVTHDELRQSALQLIEAGNLADGATLLINNFREGDFALCRQRLPYSEDADVIHHVAAQILKLCEAHPGKQALDCLLYVYECSPCSTCRNEAMQILRDESITPAWVVAESAFDADPDTRAFFSTDLSSNALRWQGI